MKPVYEQPPARVYLYESERQQVEELARFAFASFVLAKVKVTDPKVLQMDLRRFAIAHVTGLEELLSLAFEAVWLADGEPLAPAGRIERRPPGVVIVAPS